MLARFFVVSTIDTTGSSSSSGVTCQQRLLPVELLHYDAEVVVSPVLFVCLDRHLQNVLPWGQLSGDGPLNSRTWGPRASEAQCSVLYIDTCSNVLYITAAKGKVGGERSGLGGTPLTPSGDYGEVSILEPYDARRGTLVRVKEGHWKSEFAGMLGTVQKCWGTSEHAAVDVLMEDGRLELFWLPNLDAVEGNIAVKSLLWR
jgi:hypothetical protein